MKVFLVHFFILLLVLPLSATLYADGLTIDKVYHPYVQQLEKEFEYRVLYNDGVDGLITEGVRHKLGYGQSLSDNLMAEVYLIGIDEAGGNIGADAIEAELKWQLTEQGEYDNDWGMVFEIEQERNIKVWEVTSTLIVLHEWSNWIATGNFSAIYEWGDNIDNEFETAFAGQLRYRHNERLEPAIEFYKSQQTRGIGPVLTGLLRTKGGNKLNWEVGVIFGTDSLTPNTNLKFNIEYEFK
jgi:hypothetical protein